MPHYNPNNKRRKDIKHIFDNYKFNGKNNIEEDENKSNGINNDQHLHHEYNFN